MMRRSERTDSASCRAALSSVPPSASSRSSRRSTSVSAMSSGSGPSSPSGSARPHSWWKFQARVLTTVGSVTRTAPRVRSSWTSGSRASRWSNTIMVGGGAGAVRTAAPRPVTHRAYPTIPESSRAAGG